MVAGFSQHVWCRGQTLIAHHASAAAAARRRVGAELSTAGVGSALLTDTVAVLSELVGNAVRHARPLSGDMIRVGWVVSPYAIEVQVTDGGSADWPRICSVGPDAVAGRGLAIVEALCSRWGVTRERSSQCVWAELSRETTDDGTVRHAG